MDQDIANRVKRLNGQIGQVWQMIGDGCSYGVVGPQLKAVISALSGLLLALAVEDECYMTPDNFQKAVRETVDRLRPELYRTPYFGIGVPPFSPGQTDDPGD